MKMAKVITIKTVPNHKGLSMKVVSTINDQATPEQIFASLGLTGMVESYTLTKSMPLPIALEESFRLQREMRVRR